MKTKKELTEKCRSILHGKEVIDYDFLLNEIFTMPPEWNQKKGRGLMSIDIRQTKYGNKCFIIQRVDGSFTDISFTKCITKPSKEFQVKCALRNAIRFIIQDFRSAVKFNVDKCIFTNEILTNENTHIDHYNLEFNDLANIFIEKEGVYYLFENIKVSEDNMYDISFKPLALILKFRHFHNQNTPLRAISKKANLSSIIRKK